MFTVDICDSQQQALDQYNDPDTSMRHVRKASSIGAFLAITTDTPLNLIVEVEGNLSDPRRIEGTGKTALVAIQELIASTNKPSRLSRLMSFGGSQRSELVAVTEFRVSFEDPNGNSLRGTVLFKLQDEAEYDSTYGNRVKARPARPDEPQFTTDASSIQDGKNAGIAMSFFLRDRRTATSAITTSNIPFTVIFSEPTGRH